MYRNLTILFLIGLVLFVDELKAQKSSVDEHLYLREKAKSIVHNAQKAHGYDRDFSHIQNVVLTLEGTDRWLGQGESPANPVRVRNWYRRQIVDFEIGRFYSLTHTRNNFEQAWCTKTILSGELSYTYDCLSHKYRSFDLGNRPEVVKAYVNRFPEPRQYIEDAIRHLETVKWVKQANERGHKMHVVSFVDSDSSRWELFIDTENYLVKKVTGPFAKESRSRVVPVIERHYADYRKINEMYIPFQRTKLFDTPSPFESRFSELNIVKLSFNSGINDSLFNKPADIVTDTIEPAKPWTHTEVAGGIHLIEKVHSNYNAVFIEREDYIVLFDAPIDEQVSERLLTKINSIAPGKPVKYVIASHFHYDHIGGIKTFVRQGATIVASHQISSFINKFIQARKIQMKEVYDHETIGEGSMKIVVHAIGENPHSKGMLFAYLPDSKAVVVSDLFWKEYRGQLRPARQQTRLFSQRLKKMDGEVEFLIPLHGPLGTMEDLERSVYLWEKRQKKKNE